MILVITIPAIYLASKIVKDRPFSSYASSLGGWRWKLYFKCMAVPLVIYVLFNIASSLTDGSAINIQQISPLMFIAFAITIPLQCIAEEYIFRGLFMQTFGSWFKVPIVAIVLQTAIFASLHPYNFVGVLEIWVAGIGLGIIAWLAKGLESSCAYHIVNNMTIFYLTGFGYGEVTSQETWRGFLLTFACYVVYILILDQMSKHHKLR